MPYTRSVLVTAVALCGLFVAAAPPKKAVDGKVTGLVTFQGKPVKLGKISLFREDGQFVGSKIKDDGKFTIDRVQVGKFKVTIEGEDLPPKYTSDETSPLVVEVKNGDNALNFELQ